MDDRPADDLRDLVKLEFEAGEVTAIGTDGRRLAKMTGPIVTSGEPSDGQQVTIVPTRAMQLIYRAVGPNDSEVQVTIKGNEILVHTERATISSRLLEGRFPDWRKVFPEASQAGVKLELAVGATHAAVRQAAIVVSEWLQLKAQKFVNIQGTVEILVIKSLIFGFVSFAIDNAVLYQETRPQIVAIAVKQCIVQVEKG